MLIDAGEGLHCVEMLKDLQPGRASRARVPKAAAREDTHLDAVQCCQQLCTAAAAAVGGWLHVFRQILVLPSTLP
jgi:hypothetical protein